MAPIKIWRAVAAILAVLVAPYAASQAVVVRDGNGVAIGYYAGSAASFTPSGTIYPAMRVVSNTGYAAVFDPVTGSLLDRAYDLDGGSSLAGQPGYVGPWFESADCSGVGILYSTANPPTPRITAGGFVFPVFSPGPTPFPIYIRKGGGTHVIASVGSAMTSDGRCLPQGGTPGPFIGIPAGLPSVDVTGFTGDQVGPLTLGIVEPPRPDDLFGDGFETA